MSKAIRIAAKVGASLVASHGALAYMWWLSGKPFERSLVMAEMATWVALLGLMAGIVWASATEANK